VALCCDRCYLTLSKSSLKVFMHIIDNLVFWKDQGNRLRGAKQQP
jgi:hypothetical protein